MSLWTELRREDPMHSDLRLIDLIIIVGVVGLTLLPSIWVGRSGWMWLGAGVAVAALFWSRRNIPSYRDPTEVAAERRKFDLAEAETDFLDASVAVWRQIDAAEAGWLYAEGRRDREVYQGLEAGTGLRQREKAAWERYRDLLGGDHADPD